MFFSPSETKEDSAKIEFSFKNNKYMLEWLHEDFMIITTLENFWSQKIVCDASFYKNNKLIPIEELENHYLEINIREYSNDLFIFLKKTQFWKISYSIRTFLNLILNRKKDKITIWNKMSINSIFNNNVFSRIETIKINSDYLNCIPEEFVDKQKFIFLLLHSLNLHLIDVLQGMSIKIVFLAVNLFIKIIRIIFIILTFLGIMVPGLAYTYQINIDPVSVVISISVSIVSLLLYYLSWRIKSKLLHATIKEFQFKTH